MLTLVDYGTGNLRSVEKAFEAAGASVKISQKRSDIEAAQAVIVPGVGSFDHAVNELRKRGLFDALVGHLRSGKPYIGLCLGLQLLFDTSVEGEERGFGILKGSVKRFSSNTVKVPHMGWNEVQPSRPDSTLWDQIPHGTYFYFVHSYYADPAAAADTAATTTHGKTFTSVVEHGCVIATQFHPEKSQTQGHRFLKNMLKVLHL